MQNTTFDLEDVCVCGSIFSPKWAGAYPPIHTWGSRGSMISGKGSIPMLSGVLDNFCKIRFLFEQTTEEKKGKENNEGKRGKSSKMQ